MKQNGTQWVADGISVTTKTNGTPGLLPVYVSCPEKRLMRLRIHWEGMLPKGCYFLGDAWERSYGDLGWRPLDPERILP